MTDSYASEQRRQRLNFRSLGVKLYVFTRRCPTCATNNFIRRPKSNECLHCVMAERQKAMSA